jgi:phosphatidylglycerol:prolipoprotein diacylglycerol transferase
MQMWLFDRVAFHVGAISIYWYGIILATAALAGIGLAIREGKRFGVPSDFFIDLLMIGAPTAIVVARLYYVAFEWSNYGWDLGAIVNVRNGGIAIHGALIGATLAGIWWARRKQYDFLRIADICAPGLIAGQMIGRWGNFANQEAHGGAVSESFLRHTLHLPDFIVNQMYIDGAYYHPTFLYESVWNLGVLAVLLLVRRQQWLRAGELFFGYLGLYSIGRFFIEGLRTDSLAFHGPQWVADAFHAIWLPMTGLFGDQGAMTGDANIRMAQAISMGILLAMLALIWVRRATGAAQVRYLDPIVRKERM